MAKRNSKREPVKVVDPPSESDEDELAGLDLDGDVSSEDGEADAVDSDDGAGEADSEEEDAGTASDAGEDDDIEEAMLDLMAAQAERAQRRAAAKSAAARAEAEDEEEAGPEPTSRTRGKSNMVPPAAGAAGTAEAQAAEAGGGGEDDDGEQRPVDPGSDSSEDERPNRNTIGAVPLEWYKDEDHIGYDVDGRRIGKAARADKLQQLLDRNDSKKRPPAPRPCGGWLAAADPDAGWRPSAGEATPPPPGRCERRFLSGAPC
ncbi:hypothetical protein GPECTOR_36g123 [Gonium pectorale]|uniref:BOP1 N-terminal domain-containing protein n=1 Tax=Gonium pectorale TaxID=33097 RepID=A0A150GBP5_GONPE|nr:hypothetical protein GPECTOR_36g123 [Gonium pectorale]|eukprot:KXZ47271.1 hypothetical protein GPECTOR_36g123 [Gonium pectorale]